MRFSIKLLSQLIAVGFISTTAASALAAETPAVQNESTEPAIQAEEAAPAVKKADDVLTVKGLIRYDIRRDNVTGKKHETKKSLLRTRLEPTVSLGNGWKIKNRIDFDVNYKDRDEDHFYNRMIYIQGPAFGGTISAGKIDYADFANMNIAYGMIYDDYMKGVKYSYTDDSSKAIYTAAAGNFDSPHNDKNNGAIKNYPEYEAMHYAGLQAEYPVNGNFTAGFAYHNVRSGSLDETQQIFEFAGEYSFDKNFTLGGVYALSNLDAADYGLKSSDEENAYIVQLNYKGAKRAKANTFGLYAAYKSLGQLATFVPTYTNSFVGEEGYEIGGNYVFAKNLTGTVSYFNGDKLENEHKDLSRWFGRLEYRF